MAWFGGNLKNITGNLTGQLSNVANTAATFTRDVLAEGTEEVSDQTTELKVAQDKIRELEAFVISQKAENERLQILNGEMEEKAEASELQINTISNQYRTVLQEKQDELKTLKQQQHAMQDLHHNMMSASAVTAGLTSSTSTSSLSSSTITADDRDFVDVISSQHEINRLSNEVARLTHECNHWKQLADVNSSQQSQFQMGGDYLDSADDQAQLKARIKELERQLSREIDESQHQMSTLQNAHSLKMTTLSKKHKAEMEDYQIRIEELEQALSSGTSSPASIPTTPVMRVGTPHESSLEQDKVNYLQDSLKKAQQNIAQMESANQGLRLEVEMLRQADRQRGQDVMVLHQQVEDLEQEKDKLVQENDILKYVKKDLAAKLDIEQEEVKKMKIECEEMEKKTEKETELMEKQKFEEVDLLQQRIKEQEEELNNMREDNDQVRDELYATKLRLLAELDASHANTSSLRQDVQGARKKFSSQAMVRRTRLLQEKQDLVNRMIEVGEQVSEGKESVATLAAANDDMWDQTADIISDMGSTDQQELTSEFIACLESENKILRDKVIHLESVEGKLNESCASLAEDKDQCEKMIVKLNRKIQSLKQGKDVLDPETSSERTLECAVDSETESTPKLKTSRPGSQRRAQSPSVASTDSDATPSSGVAPSRGYMSEGTVESDLPDGRLSHMESSDNVSFDGEYDDSIMFGGIKERYPEAANALKEQIEQFELVRADWEMEKEALEEVVVRMRDQLKEKDRDLQSLTAEKGLMELETQQTEELNAAVEEMDQKIETLESAKKTLEEDKALVIKEKESLELKIKDLESTHQEQVGKLQALTEQKEHLQVQLTEHGESINNLSLEVETYRSQLQEKEASLLDISQDRSRLESELEELDNQHQEAINQVISSKDDLSKMVESLKGEVSSLSEQLIEKDTVLNESLSLKENLETELEQFKERLQQENQELSDVQKSGQDHQQQTSLLKSELGKLSESNKVLDNRKRELEVEVNELSTKAASLEADLLKAKQQCSDMIDGDEKTSLDDIIAKLQQDLKEAAASKEQKEKECENLQSVLAQKESEFGEVLSEKEHLNRTLNEKEDQCQVLSHNMEQTSKELSDLQLDIEALSAEKESLSLDLKHNQQAMDDQKQQFENTLHELSESRDLDTSNVQDEYEKLILVKNEQDSELAQLKTKCDDLEDDLSHTKDMLNSTLENHTQLAEMVKEKDTDIKNLAEENSFFFKAVEEGKTKLKEQVEELKRLENIDSQLDDLNKEKASLAMRIRELEDAGNHWQDAESKTLGLITEMEAELGQFRMTLQEKDAEVSRLNQVIEEQQTSLSELQDQCSHQADELELSRSKLAESTNDFTSLNHSIRDKDVEILELSKELENIKQMLSDEQNSKLEEADSSFAAKEAEVSELRHQVDELSAELNNTNQSFIEKLTQKDEEIGTLQQHVTELNQDVESNQRKANDMQDKVDKVSVEKDQIIAELKDKVEDLSPKNGSVDNLSGKKDFQTNGTVVESPVIVRDVELTQSAPSSVSNPNLHPAMSDTEKQFEKMVQERDREIKILNEKNQSALSLLEEKSQSSFGNSSLVDMHKLQMQVRTFNSERNQMMTVLNEKTRECSNLKNEVHRLVKTIAAEKSALEKALSDNRDLQQSLRGPRNDMQKEAVQKLSRLIQDKDLEMEALKQKNESLLQVLQQSAAPNDSTQISKVLQDNEHLQKENKVLKEERDQLVVSIHQKHHESLTYYEEVQRLAGVINSENQKHAELQQKYNSVYADLDDREKRASELEAEIQEKDKSLSALQSELDQRNESVSFMESRLVNLNESVAGLEGRNQELDDMVSANHQKQNQEEDLHLKVLEEKDAEIVGLKQQLQSLTLMSLDQAEDREVIKAVAAPVQHAPPPPSQHVTPPPTASQVDSAILETKDKEISTLKDKVEHQTRLISEKEAAIKKRNEELERNHIDIASLRQEIDIQNQNLLDRDAALQFRNHKQQELENRLQSQGVELQSLKHAKQTLTVQMQSCNQEIKSLKNENQTLQHAVHNKDGENRSLQDLSNRLAVQVQEKDFEIGALKEKNATLTSIVQEKDVGSQGELQRVLRETEAMQRQAQLFQHERDQALLALQRHQADTQSKDDQIQGHQQKEQQLGRELERLRNHLLEMEDGYTQEALQAEEREKELRTKLVHAEEKARTSSSAVQNASKEATAQIESLLDQLHSATEQRDQALLQLGSVQEQAQQYGTSLNNLQMVLEQFQQEKDISVASEVEMYQIRAEEKDKVAGQLMRTNVELQEKLAAATEALEGASRLSEQLDKKEEFIEQLRIDNETKGKQLEEFQKRFQEVSNVQESKVDKPLVKNLFLGYFHAPKSKRGDVLKVMASLLNFTPDEIGQISVEGQQPQGWLSGLWGRRGTVTPTPPSSPRPRSAFDTSFTESFVKFLEEESCPKPHMRLPLEEMTSNKPRNPAFNPFSAPIPQNSPFIQTSPIAAKGPGVPLPVPAVNTLTTVPAPVRSVTPVMDGGLGPGRGSPARSAAVLKDILQ